MNKIAIFCFLLYIYINGFAQSDNENQSTFTNPIITSGADPWIIYRDGFYYYTNTSGGRLFLIKAKNLAELKKSEQKTVWMPPAGTSYSKEIWAPELHFIKGKWYIYFAADDGNNKNHRIYVIENSSKDPLEGKWEFKGKVSDPSDKWAIDASIFEFKGVLYMLWSGWEGDINGQQNIYISKMKNPWTIDGSRVLISSPIFNWETVGDLNNPNDVPHVNVNEGPVALIHGKKLFVLYSASGCWTDSYCLGLLTYTGKNDLLDKNAWKKNPVPVFKQKPEYSVYAPGHNCFFNSPDGKETWIMYHANSQPGQGCGRYRSPRAQIISWNQDNTPNLGDPVKPNELLRMPSETNIRK